MGLIQIAVLYNLIFGLFHLFFWINWKEELKQVSPLNKAIFQTLNLCLSFTLLMVACILFFNAEEILVTEIGKALLLGMTLFWFVRSLAQIFFFDLKNRVSQFFLVIFLAGVVIHLSPLTL